MSRQPLIALNSDALLFTLATYKYVEITIRVFFDVVRKNRATIGNVPRFWWALWFFEMLKSFDAVPCFVAYIWATDLTMFKVGLIHQGLRPNVSDV